jgi:hypothetical protein
VIGWHYLRGLLDTTLVGQLDHCPSRGTGLRRTHRRQRDVLTDARRLVERVETLIERVS